MLFFNFAQNTSYTVCSARKETGTIGNQIVVLPNGTPVDLFNQLDKGANSTTGYRKVESDP